MSEDQRQAIIDGLQAGTPYRTIAAEARCGTATVGRVAKANGLTRDVPQIKNAVAASHDYDQTNRLQLLNRLFDKLGDLRPECAKPNELQALAMTAAILIDKRRLEDGEVTSRTEINESGDRDRAVARITDIAQRRRAS